MNIFPENSLEIGFKNMVTGRKRIHRNQIEQQVWLPEENMVIKFGYRNKSIFGLFLSKYVNVELLSLRTPVNSYINTYNLDNF